MIKGMLPKFINYAARRSRNYSTMVLIALSLAVLAGFIPGNWPVVVGAQPGSGTASPAASGEAVLPFPLATPAPDGEIIHVVQEGQNLITIAQAYKISLAQRFSLNNLTDQSVI
jgi:hypothetical protein